MHEYKIQRGIEEEMENTERGGGPGGWGEYTKYKVGEARERREATEI